MRITINCFFLEANKSCEPSKAYIYSVIILSTLLAALLAIVACFIYRALRAKKARSTGARSYELLVTKKRDVEKNLEEVDDGIKTKIYFYKKIPLQYVFFWKLSLNNRLFS